MVEYVRYNEYHIPMMLVGIERCVKSYGYSKLHFDNELIRNMLIGNINNKNFFCTIAISEGVPIGGLCASVQRHIMSPEVYAEDHFLYIIPEYQAKLGISTALVAEYEKWGRERNIKRLRLTQSNGNKPEKFTRFAKHFGFELLGGIHEKELV